MIYRVTPFHFLATLLFGGTLYLSIITLIENDDPGIAGVLPGILLSFSLLVILIDFILQAILYRNRKLLYATQLILIIAILIWAFVMDGN